MDQLAELLTEYENADTTRALPADKEVTIPLVLPEMQPSRDERENLVPPQVAEAFEALRRALRSAGVGPDDLDAPLPIGKSPRVPLASGELGRPVAVDTDPEAALALGPALSGLPADMDHPVDINIAGAGIGPDTPVPTTVNAGGLAGSDVPEPGHTLVPRRPSLTTIPLDVEPADLEWHRARSRRFKRLAAAGVLAVIFAGGAASVPFMTSHSGPIPPAGAGHPVLPPPAAAIPGPNAGSGNDNSPHREDSTGAVQPTPAEALDKAAGDPAPPAAAAVPAPHTIRARSPKRTTSRPKSPASTATPPAPRTPAIPAEAYSWYEMAEASAGDQRRTRLRPESPPRP